MSTRLAEQSGAKAIATTSAGISWSLGYPDNQLADRKIIIKVLDLITSNTNLPVSADIEDGLLAIGENMDHLVQDLYSVECLGINIEDTQNGKSMSIKDGSERIASVRTAANKLNYDLFINARIDSWLRNESTEPEHLISRANSYLTAGADCIFIPGLTDLKTCQIISSHINGPLNIMARTNAPNAEALFAAGVKRISGGSFFAEQAYGITLAGMERFLKNGILLPNNEANISYLDLNIIVA
ncbi:isocitrate lyase/PEP mutase family protein [Xenorhabdus hominickii]|uniref:Carboxyvinyl-carboxyphosphonate phosphorylmutase n=1 Tax=Xenorhabdus hominickii TaxID=351679 RepID=A0A2G0Q6S0_XENHO|nr:isocitrate lyase/phosphoenolpyruvate mutase family protein [Xenorhabdus hominickii]AOM39354.1 hypothetical protein A9255_01245 [Xenorhabdus hominickii]PHM54891.1 carboxyvinyl-carboxyphosphonate phosphorylmutase [Xenorhabdus hominickii]